MNTYHLSAKMVEDTLCRMQDFSADTLEIVPQDTINIDSIAKFTQKLDSVLLVFQTDYQIQKRGKAPSASNYKFDPNRKVVLITGDSMGDLIFFPLRKLRKANGFEIVYKPDYGSKISEWAKTRRLVRYIQKYRPDFIILTLGSNEILRRVNPQKIKNINKIRKHLKGTEYVWVGPPNWKPDWGLDSIIHANVGSSHYFVSKNFNFKRRSDGAHPTAYEGEVWTDTLARWINRNPIYQFNFTDLPPRRSADFERICRQPNHLTAKK